PFGYNGNYTVTGVTGGVSYTFTTGSGLGATSVGGSWYQGPVNNNCTAITSTCIIIVPNTIPSGAMLIATVWIGNTASYRSISSVTCTTGTSDVAFTSVTSANDSTRGEAILAYNLQSNGGCTQYTVTLSGNSTS